MASSLFRRRPNRGQTLPLYHRPSAKPDLQRYSTISVASSYPQQTIRAYNLDWTILKKWLVDRFEKNDPNITTILETHEMRWDLHHFRTPQELSQNDMDEIEKLRRKFIYDSDTDPAKHRGQTPDPPLPD